MASNETTVAYQGPCGPQLMAADACVQADPGTCGCFTQPFMDNFWVEVSLAYKTTLAFEIPGSEFFCSTANDNVCKQLETSGNCCCETEVNNFITCSFASEWNIAFGAGDCPYDMCGAGGDAEGGGEGESSKMIIIIICVVVFGYIIIIIIIK